MPSSREGHGCRYKKFPIFNASYELTEMGKYLPLTFNYEIYWVWQLKTISLFYSNNKTKLKKPCATGSF
jgi:hypothetical protein